VLSCTRLFTLDPKTSGNATNRPKKENQANSPLGTAPFIRVQGQRKQTHTGSTRRTIALIGFTLGKVLRTSPDPHRLGRGRLLKVTPRTACTGRCPIKASYHVTASLRHSHWITAPSLSGQTKSFPSICSQSTGVPTGNTPSSPHKRSSAPADRITHNWLKNVT